MKKTAIRRSLPFLVLGLSLVAASAHAQLGKLRFGCQVNTTTDKQGYISVRADSKEEAITMAGRAQAVSTRLETREPAKDVVECVPIPDGRFKDGSFQDWVENVLPR